MARLDRQTGQAAEPTARAKFRCAIYTRKSSDEGLEQSFNSLHAQRDACEAYVASQKHEGWVALPTQYDDGGLSGGSMNRPALQQLLADIAAGLIDIVVVYKVDRLTRSLADFAKLTELLEKHGASFVSVTQNFNTSNSMGRLTLNVLLSFAQFEREVAGERIRDKIALSKRRGMWMGGLPPLGYDGIDRQLVINDAEAATVRSIYQQYLQVGSVSELKRRLDAQAIVSKRRVFSDGKVSGGLPITRGALYSVLRNQLYRGEIAHHGEIHAGNHEAIITPELWYAVQTQLMHGSKRERGADHMQRRAPQLRSAALLAGFVFDEDGNRLTPSYTNKGGRRYCYYVSAPAIRGERQPAPLRVPAAELEQRAIGAIADYLSDARRIVSLVESADDAGLIQDLIKAGNSLAENLRNRATSELPATDAAIRTLIKKLVVGKQRLAISLNATAIRDHLIEIEPSLTTQTVLPDDVTISTSAHALRCGKQVRLVLGKVDTDEQHHDADLIDLIANARRWFKQLSSGKRASIAEIAEREGQQVSEVSRSISLAFLAPDIVSIIAKGQQPATLTVERLRAARPLPSTWSAQRTLLLDASQPA